MATLFSVAPGPCAYPDCRHSAHEPKGSFTDACVDFFQHESKLILKFFNHLTDVLPMVRSMDEPTKLLCGRMNVVAGDGAKAISVASIPRQLGLVGVAVVDFAQDPSIEHVRDLVCNQIMSLGDLTCDGIDLMSRHVYQISPQAMRVVEGASGLCALVMSVNGLFDNYIEVSTLTTPLSFGKKIEVGAKVGANFSFALFGALALGSACAVLTVASWMISASLISGFVFTLFVFFSERMIHSSPAMPHATLMEML